MEGIKLPRFTTMNSILSIIDLGTNTFHLLIAEQQQGSYRILYRDKQAVRLGQGGINQNKITDSGVTRAIRTLKLFKEKIDLYASSNILAYGTSALRNALNQKEVIQKIKQETGISITVISGDQEAELIYFGIHYGLKLGEEKSLIIDIGGGSVEFIIGNASGIEWKRSIEIGGQRLMELFQKHDPILPEEIKTLDQYFNSVLSDLFEALETIQPKTLIGSSGTFDTLSDIYCLKNGINQHEDDPETPLTFEGFYEIYRELIFKNRDQRMAMPGMIELRVDMIVVSCCLIRYLIEHYSFQTIRVSGYSLKEGALYLHSKTIT